MISTHLSPEPERRLWTICENVRDELRYADKKLAAITGLCAAELAFTAWDTATGPAGPLALVCVMALTAGLLLGLAAFCISRAPKRLFLAAGLDERRPDDSFVDFEDLAKYSHGDLIARFDKYLGGGIAATHYFEDIVGQIHEQSRVAASKRRLLRWVCWPAGAGQLLLAARLVADVLS